MKASDFRTVFDNGLKSALQIVEVFISIIHINSSKSSILLFFLGHEMDLIYIFNGKNENFKNSYITGNLIGV